MDFKHNIIHCRGLKPKFDEISLLISQYNPSVFCLQETFLKPDDTITLKGFDTYKYIHSNCQKPSGGSSIFVKSSCPQRNIQLTTELQATAVSVTLDKEITICSIYIPPSLESPYHLVAVSGAHFTQGTILIVIIVSSGSAKSRTHQSAVGGFLVTRRGWPGRLRACRIWTFINSV